jgi:hypothetical protein
LGNRERENLLLWEEQSGGFQVCRGDKKNRLDVLAYGADKGAGVAAPPAGLM